MPVKIHQILAIILEAPEHAALVACVHIATRVFRIERIVGRTREIDFYVPGLVSSGEVPAVREFWLTQNAVFWFMSVLPIKEVFLGALHVKP